MVERQPSKLRVAGSNPVSRSIKRRAEGYRGIKSFGDRATAFLGDGDNAHVAQSAEHILGKDEVTGSIPVMGSRNDG